MPDGAPFPTDADAAKPCARATISLRILATTDLHMNIGAAARSGGLARLAPVIAAERATHANVMLFDNGDLLEGSALADDLAAAGLGPHDIHPAIAALNRLGYDAATLGNHDFSHGTEFLRRVLRDARHAVTLANAGLVGDAPPPWSETLLLRREMRDGEGRHHDIAIGVFGVTPPQTVEWEAGLAREMTTEDVLTASRRAVSSLRARGADVIVALSHGGYETGRTARPENAAGAIAAIAGVDAVIAGHTHEIAARPATCGRAAIVEAGCGGSHLAAISLRLRGGVGRDGPGTWRIDSTAAETLPAARAACPEHLAAASALPAGTARRLNTAIGTVGLPLSSHFALLGADSGLRLTEAALRDHVARALPGCPLPVLTAFAPFRTGGRGGPDHFVDIPAGPVRRGDLSTLYPFTNHVAAIEITGETVAAWLDRAAAIFAHLPGGGGPARPLIDARIPGHQFEIIAGLDYAIDLSAPAADADGTTGTGTRIRELRHRGRPVLPADRFLLVTNSYRMSGGPLYGRLTHGRRCLLPETARRRVRDIIADHLAAAPRRSPSATPFFRLTASAGARAWLDTAPGADPAACPVPVRADFLTGRGFRRLEIQLQTH